MSRSLSWLALMVAALLLAVACGSATGGGSDAPRTGHFLPAESGSTGHAVSVGDQIEFELPIDPPHTRTVVLDHVTFQQLPSGLTVAGLHAYDRRRTDGGFVVITAKDRQRVTFQQLPFQGLVLTPSSINYYETVAFVAHHPGEFHAKQVNVVYRVGSTWYHQTEDWEFDVTAS